MAASVVLALDTGASHRLPSPLSNVTMPSSQFTSQLSSVDADLELYRIARPTITAFVKASLVVTSQE